MKKFLLVGSSLASVVAASSAGAVDVTLGGSIDIGVEYGLGKNYDDLTVSGAFNRMTLSIKAAHTTDGGLAFGGSFTMGSAAELKFNPYQTTGASGATAKYLAKKTVAGRTAILGHAYDVSGGAAIDPADIVSVKINSDWLGVDPTQTGYLQPIAASSFKSIDICKVAGKVELPNRPLVFPDLPNFTTPYSKQTWATLNGVPSLGARYLPAGQVGRVWRRTVVNGAPTLTQVGAPVRSAAVSKMEYGGTEVGVEPWSASGVLGRVGIAPALPATPKGINETIYWRQSKGYVVFPDGETVGSARVFVGPFMEVMMASSSTKMVVGAVCLTGVEESGTGFYMDNASKVMTVSDASIYIEGGFGKLSLQSGNHTGGVSAIAGAGDQADIDADGWVIAAEGYGLMGANPFIAMDLNKGDSLGDIEVITGGTFDLGGLSAAFDVALDNPTDVLGISSWDLGATYAMGDLALGFATDSSNDWGLSAAMDLAGFGVSAVFGSSSAGDHEKAGITYVVTATTALNGYNLAIGFDQSLKPALGVDYDLGGLNIYANYDAADEGGSVGATLSF